MKIFLICCEMLVKEIDGIVFCLMGVGVSVLCEGLVFDDIDMFDCCVVYVECVVDCLCKKFGIVVVICGIVYEGLGKLVE